MEESSKVDSKNFEQLSEFVRGRGRLTRRGHVERAFLLVAPHGGTRGEALSTFGARIVGDTKVGFCMIFEVKVRQRATGA